MAENKEKKCPLCEVSPETLNILKEKSQKPESSEKTEKKRGFFNKIFNNKQNN